MDRASLPAGVVGALERFRCGLTARFGERLKLLRLYGWLPPQQA